ncbi:MAG: hypothetical protein P8177_04780 [Gemmatimonadota bacterium]|jgi:hypothetical protein
MRRPFRKLALCLCALTLAACAPDAAEEEVPVEEAAPAQMATSPLAQWAGTWEAVTVLESGDTVQYSFTATDTREGWMVSLPDRDPMPLRVVTAEADSIVTEMGPYESLLRDGVQVTVRQVARIQGERLTGTMEAMYEGGDGPTTVAGEVEGSRAN